MVRRGKEIKKVRGLGRWLSHQRAATSQIQCVTSNVINVGATLSPNPALCCMVPQAQPSQKGIHMCATQEGIWLVIAPSVPI